MADSHVHLHAYPDDEVAAMLERSGAVRVGTIVAVSIDLESGRRSLALAERLAGVLPAVGLHPMHLRGMPGEAEWTEVERLIGGAAAVGECGVDAGAAVSRAVQLAVLARQCRLAARSGKALLLHLVGQELVGPALGVLAAAGVPSGRAVAHYFQGDRAEARRLLEAGVLISVGKPVMRLAHLQEAVREVPLEWLLLETDTYPLPGRTTEPADVRLVCEAVAELKGIAPAEVAEATTRNLTRLLVGGAAGG